MAKAPQVERLQEALDAFLFAAERYRDEAAGELAELKTKPLPADPVAQMVHRQLMGMLGHKSVP